MAGTGASVGFNASTFRDAIGFAMRMGQPQDPTKGVTFRWATTSTYSIHDPATRPYNWGATAAAVDAVTDLQVVCAVEFHAAGAGTAENPVGVFNEATLVITLLDEQYDAIVAHGVGRFPDQVQADDDTYEIRFIPPPNGLFDVTVWSVHCVALAET